MKFVRQVAQIVLALQLSLLGLGIDQSRAQQLADGPFGLKFGSSQSAVPHRSLGEVDLRNGHDHCVQAALTVTHGSVPNDWGIAVEQLFSTSVPQDVVNGLRDNRLKATLSINGDLKVGYYAIPIGGKGRRFCLGFFNDKLFLVSAQMGEYLDLIAEMEAALTNRYGEPDLYGQGQITVKKWLGQKDRVVVRRVASRAGELSYTFAPVKSEQMRAIVTRYWEKWKEVGGSSRF